MSFTIKQYKKDLINPGNTLVFIDSVLNDSLVNLVKDLEGKDFCFLIQAFDANVLEFFPYDYWNSFEKFNQGLPRKDKFYKSLTDYAINDEDYEQHGIIIWKAFIMKNMKDFHESICKIRCFIIGLYV